MRPIAVWSGQIGLVAVAYLAAAQLGGLLTLRPDQAAVVSPAAGIALAAILQGGFRLWPGIFLGSMAFHLAGSGYSALVPAAAFAIGAVLQALAGASLIRWLIGYPTSLIENRDIWLFLVLAGPVQGLIDPTWSTAWRCLLNDSWAGFATDWLHAWAGNSLGAVLVLLLILPALGRPREVWRPRLVSVAVPLLLLLTAVGLFVRAARGWERERISIELAAEAKQGHQAVQGWFRNGTVGLNGWQSDLNGFADTPRDVLHRRAEALLKYHDTLRAVALVVRVDRRERADFEARQQAQGLTGFRIRRATEDPADAAKPDYACVTLHSPRAQEDRLVGSELADQSGAPEAFRQASDTNKPVALPYSPLSPTAHTDDSLLVVLPLYASGKVPATPEERERQTRGYALAVFNMDVILAKATPRLAAQGIQTSWRPTRGPDDADAGARWDKSGVEMVMPVTLAGNEGEVRFHAGRAWLKQRQTRHVWLIMVLGLTLNVLLGAALLTATGRTALVQTEVRQRTAELRAEVEVRRRTEESLRQAKEAAEAASRAKSEFLANVSHELRTPMNGIMGMTDLALDTPLTADQREYLTLVQSSAASLLTLLNDLLDFSKIEAGKMDLESVDFSLRSIVNDTLAALSPRARSKELALTGQINDDVPDILCGDPGRLRQVLVNLLGNAIKFTDRGEVVLSVQAVNSASTGSSITLSFQVRDTGIGIPAEKHQKIFEAFEQADNSMTRKYGGTGLGLAISSRLVGLLGGRLGVESAIGQGSTFHFTARFVLSSRPAALEPAPAPHPPPPPYGPLKILLAEDNDINQKLVAALLHKWGHTVVIAGDGKAVLDAVERQQFDLVLMDIQMPEMNGFEVTAHIRKGEQGSGRRVRIVALTAHAMRGDRERCLQAGMDGYLAKPVRAQELFEVIAGTSAAPRERPEPELPAAPAPELVLDPVAVRDTFGDDVQLFRESAQLFLVRCPQLLGEIRDSVNRRDAGDLTRAAHTFHGLVGFFSPRTGEAAARLVKIARSGNLQDAPEATTALEALVGRLQREVADAAAVNSVPQGAEM